MLDLELSTSDRQAYIEALRESHRMRVRVEVLDRDEKVMHALDAPASQIITGSVHVDARSDVTRSLELELLDEKRALGFDAASPSRTALFADNFLRVYRGAWVRSLSRWIDVPVFTGPVTGFERTAGDVVKIEALGKEALALDPHFVTQGYTLRKGRRVDDAIRDVMNRVGERRYNLPSMPKRLPRARAVEPEDEPWDVVKFGFESHERRLDRQRSTKRRRRFKRVDVEYNGLIALAGHFTIYYNGRGQLTARRRSTNPVLELREGRDLEALPIPTWDVLEAVNHVVVTGAKVHVGKRPHRRQVQRRSSATLGPEHPLSPARLARNGVLRRMTEFVTVENLKTDRACRDRARRILAERSRDGLVVSFKCLPFSFLEELDFVRIVTEEYSLDLPLHRFTIPLTDSELMTVDYER